MASHRHAPEIEQEISRLAGHERRGELHSASHADEPGELCTAYARLRRGATAADCAITLQRSYDGEPFIVMAPRGIWPATQYVRGSNNVMLGAYADRMPGRVILVGSPR